MVLTVASSLETDALVRGIKSAVKQVDADLPLGTAYPVRETVDAELARPRFLVLLVSGFGAIALVLTVIGLWGVIAYTVTRRTKEVGVRMALGAAPRQLLWLVLGRGLRLALAGVALGAGGALLLSNGLDRFLYGTTGRDPLTYVAAVVGFVAIALGTSYLPARRALRVDPMTALRSD
ncbi:MAG: FtsX-like permease family protein [Gemmatimonadota bacterium]